jgi:ATP-binding cassette subfamily C (CFTR/MRP) protein 1
VLELSLLILWSTKPLARTNASIPSSLLSLIASVTLVPLSQLEHARSVQPSSPVTLYLLASILLDIPQLRTLFFQEGTLGIAVVFLAVLIAKLVFFLVEVQGKEAILRQEFRELPPESTSSTVNRSFLWWMNNLFVLGSKGTLSSSSLYALDGELKSRQLGEKMRKAWSRRGTLCSQPADRQFVTPYLDAL